jgi:putative membrane protein
MERMAMMYYGHGMGAWGWMLMTGSWLLFWGLLAFGIVALVRFVGRSGRNAGPSQSPSPQQVLAERFARGEIDEDEYQRRLRVLGATPPAGAARS